MTDLHERARSLGVATHYDDWTGRRVDVADDVVAEVCDLLDDGTAESPLLLFRRGRADGVRVDHDGAHLLRAATGEDRSLRADGQWLPVPADLPIGWHDLVLPSGDEVPLLVAPERCPAVPERPVWGWMTQLYALRSARSWGIGDLADLRDLAQWSATELGCAFVLINPLHAGAPGLPQQASPYAATSRRFTNPLYLCLDDVPERASLDEESAARFAQLEARARELNGSALIDRDDVYRRKSAAWELLFAAPRSPAREEAFQGYVRREGEGLERFAVWCALAEQHGSRSSEWPADVRDPTSAAVAAARAERADRVELYRWLQWLCDEQLDRVQSEALAAGMAAGVVHDLAVGADPEGADAWAQQDVLARGVTIGAPPDEFNKLGQDWALPPWRPQRLRATRYAAFRDLLCSVLRHAGGLRIDHALGLWRLWWIPEGRGPDEGTYVSYPADEMLAVLATEAYEAEAIVVAEDLGTVPPDVPPTLRDWGISTSAVLWFEREGDGSMRRPSGYLDQVLASVTTHDLPTARGFWRGEGLRVRAERDLFPDADTAGQAAADDERARDAMVRALREEGLVGDQPTEDELVVAMHAFLGRTPARLLAVNLADAVGDLRQPNLPGTTDEYPNWKQPLANENGGAVTLEGVLADPRVRHIIEAVDRT